MRTEIEPLLRKYGVQVVLSGHDHNYERIQPMYGGRPSSTEKVGVLNGGPGMVVDEGWGLGPLYDIPL